MTFILTYLILFIEVVIAIYLVKHFVNKDHLIMGIFIVGIAIIIAILFYSIDFINDYEEFEEKEVENWEYLTGKRIIKLMFKYHLSLVSDIVLLWDV